MANITFNTQRGYSAEGQIIHATILNEDESGWLTVAVADVTRRIDFETDVTHLSQAEIMDAYDAGGYDSTARSRAFYKKVA